MSESGGDGSSTGVGMGMIIGLLVVLLIVVGGGFYLFGGHASAPANPVAAVADGATHTVTGTVTAK
jgi:flagellar motor component MotA